MLGRARGDDFKILARHDNRFNGFTAPVRFDAHICGPAPKVAVDVTPAALDCADADEEQDQQQHEQQTADVAGRRTRGLLLVPLHRVLSRSILGRLNCLFCVHR